MKKLTRLLIGICLCAVCWLSMPPAATGETVSQFPNGVSTPYLYDYDTSHGWLGAYRLTVPTLTANDTLTGRDTTDTLTNKTLTTPIVSSFYQDAGKTKLMTVPNTASDTLCAIVATQTLTNKTLTAPVVATPDFTLGVTTHDYGAAAADWTLSAAEMKATLLTVSNASGAANIIAPNTSGKVYIVVNGSGQAITIKKSGGTGVAVATTKTATVIHNGTDYIRVTADQ